MAYQAPEYKLIENGLYRKLPGDEVKYYIHEIQRLKIEDNDFWLELSSCQDNKWIEEKKKELSNISLPQDNISATKNNILASYDCRKK